MKLLILTFTISTLLLRFNATGQTPTVLSTFHNVQVDGCADYFFLSKYDKNKQKYICIHDFAQIAYVKINKKLEKFIYKPGKTTDDALFANKEYTLNIKVISKKATGPESYSLKAIMNIYHNGKLVITEKIIGGGGC